MEKVLFTGRNLSEKRPSIKRKRPKNAVSRDIDWPHAFSEWYLQKTGICDVRNPSKQD